MFQKVKAIFLDVAQDFWSTINHANELILYSSTENVIVFFLASILFIFIVVFNSHNQVEFYINLLRVFTISFSTFFIFCLSDYFWFLIKRKEVYKWNIKQKKRINILLKRVRKDKNLDKEGNFEEKIIGTVGLNTIDYKYHAKRYAAEICFFFYILTHIDSNFVVFNLLVFGVMYAYVFLCEQQSIAQAFDSIKMLLYYIDKFNKENSEKCKKFMTENKQQEIKDLTMLYQAVLKIK